MYWKSFGGSDNHLPNTVFNLKVWSLLSVVQVHCFKIPKKFLQNPVPRGPSGFDLLQGLSDGKYMLCAGVSLVNKKRLIRCLRRVKATHVVIKREFLKLLWILYLNFLWKDKVRNFFTLEPINEGSVLRSRKCLFSVTEEEDLERRQREAEEDGKKL